MTNWKHIALSAVAVAAMTGCGDTTISYGDSTVSITGDTVNPGTNGDTTTPDVVLDLLTAASSLPTETLSGSITSDMTLTKDKVWLLSGQVVVERDANAPSTPVTLTIEPGTIIAGIYGDGAAAGWMVINKDAKIEANGTATEPIIFTGQRRVNDPSNNGLAQWGGLTIIGNAGNSQITQYEVTQPRVFTTGQGIDNDNSGSLQNVYILNSGIGVGTADTEINGLSLVAVGNQTVIEDITVDYSDDDCIEIWGGTVNLTNITLSHCTDDHLDTDDGYAGTVKNATINASIGYAGIEQSGETYAHYEDFTINIVEQIGEGGIYFKGSKIGGHFKNVTINYETDSSGAIYSDADANTYIKDPTYTTMENVIINTTTGHDFVNKNNDTSFSADEIKDTFFTSPYPNTYGNEVNYN